MRRWLTATAGVLLLFPALAACVDSASTKAGGPVAEVVTLRIGTNDFPGRLAAEQIADFAQRVEALSDGTILIEPVFRAAGMDVREWDQRVARMVVSGELDMGLVPARAWDTERVTSMRALHAPFLVTSSELRDQIVTGELATPMLAGLEPIGVTGLALIPEYMRYVFSYGPALSTPAAFEGVTIWAPWSATSFALFEALGANGADLEGREFEEAVARSEIALETTLDFESGPTFEVPTAVAGDLVLYPKVNTLVVNSDRFDDLSDSQQEHLRRAATGATSGAIARQASEASLARRFCDDGGQVVKIGAERHAAFVEAAAPVYAELERDAQTARLIREIRDLAGRVSVDPTVAAAACEGDLGGVTPTSGGSDDPPATPASPPDPALDGVYRVEWTEKWLRSTFEQNDVDEDVALRLLYTDVGIWELTFDAGRFELHRLGAADVCHGRYTTSGNQIRITASTRLDSRCGGGMAGRTLVDARYDVVGSELRLSDFQISPTVDETHWYQLFGALPPQRTS